MRVAFGTLGVVLTAVAAAAVVAFVRVTPLAPAALGRPTGAARPCAPGCAPGRSAPPPVLAWAEASPAGRSEATALPHRVRLPPPALRRPLTILSVGDSLGEDLGLGLADVLSADPNVRIVEDAVGSTGLADVAYYDWRSHLARDLARSRPQVVVVMLGGNDAVSFDQDGRYVAFASPLWRRLYGARVRALMLEARRAGAAVEWVGMPVMAGGSVLSDDAMRTLNAAYRRAAAGVPGVAYLSTWRLFQAPGGGFTVDLTTRSGGVQVVRDPDGVHIAPPAGDALVASAVVAAIDRAEGVRLCLAADDMWRRFHAPRCPTRPPA